MGSRQVTIELPDDVYERLVAASRAAGSSLDTTILDLVGRGLSNGACTPSLEASADMLAESHRTQAALRERIRQVMAATESRRRRFDPDAAAEFRRRMPVLDPPLSRTIIEDREDRV